jgi:long-subunit acyl-CoA synthetase (AMP-forming)
VVDSKQGVHIRVAKSGAHALAATEKRRVTDDHIGRGCVCAIGDGRPYNVARVTLDPEAAAEVGDPQAEVAAQIDRANENLARVEQIKRFALLEADWPPGGDELTPTMKLKRKPIAAKYAAEIEALYA